MIAHTRPATRSARRFALMVVTILSLAVFTRSAIARSGALFRVTLDGAVANAPVKGRLLVLLIGPGAKLPPNTKPLEAPFWDDIQPIFSADVTINPGSDVRIDDDSDAYPLKPSELIPGDYQVQARLIASRQSSNWKNDPGNFYTASISTFTIKDKHSEALRVDLKLDTVTKARDWPAQDGIELVEIKSTVLSAFHGRDVMLRAGVVLPIGWKKGDFSRRYPAVYEIGGFGNDHFNALNKLKGYAKLTPGVPAHTLAQNVFWIVPDPESPNGHTLFADSANNGPCGEALVRELIPELEKRYPLIAEPSARLLRGHSSGGWSTLWLALQYADVFGACWSSAPDPVDFRRFQAVNIYDDQNFFTSAKNEPTPSFRRNGQNVMTVRQEVTGEQFSGPNNTSGQQWASWQAVWGPRDVLGYPAPLFNPKDGAINRRIADQYQRYDINLLLREHPGAWLPLFQNNIRLLVGDQDSFFLNEAVSLLDQTIDELVKAKPGLPPRAEWIGYIKVLPKFDHSTIFMSKELRAIPEEMLAHLAKHHHLASQPTPPAPPAVPAKP